MRLTLFLLGVSDGLYEVTQRVLPFNCAFFRLRIIFFHSHRGIYSFSNSIVAVLLGFYGSAFRITQYIQAMKYISFSNPFYF